MFFVQNSQAGCAKDKLSKEIKSVPPRNTQIIKKVK